MELTHPYRLSYLHRRGRKFGHVIVVDSINIFKPPHRLWIWTVRYTSDNHALIYNLKPSVEVVGWLNANSIQFEMGTRGNKLRSDEVIFSFAKREHAMRFKIRFG